MKKTVQSALLLLLSHFSHPIDGSPPGSPVPGILQARTLELVAISFSNAWRWNEKVKSLSHVGLLATPWTAAYQAPPSMGFSRQEYWSGVPLPSPSSISSPCSNATLYIIGFSKTLDYSVKKNFLLSIYYVPKHRTLVLEPQIDSLCSCYCFV